MSEELSIELLDPIKLHLRVTWDSQDSEIKEYIEEGIAYINGICGESNYSVSGLPTILLKAYCRRSWAGNISTFEEDYRRQLLRLQHENGVRRLRRVVNAEKE
ncbi:TPA: phage head-tail connector protein [Streptococcus suis]|nr:phage head-tail connector protein [Streptococcus suis]HEM3622657.1 phage head-tail connector protein [Streptococcus suis]HEM3628897.1 phage head-tail connector protein [Streptococcus suis]HEM3630913.1 phage head-tail connector protein [Streptococcus suis]HEM3715160.1 phage head-tail connector protein [Streptococcus suis]